MSNVHWVLMKTLNHLTFLIFL